jgi:hypothetical protein
MLSRVAWKTMKRLCSDDTLETRLMAKVVKGASEDACWAWTGARYAFGYGTIGTSKGNDGAHRVSYRLFVGPIPDGMCVLHRCDNPECANPKHLFTGSKKDNAVDRNAKGRGKNPRHVGVKNPNAKLVPSQVLAIRESSLSAAEASEKYGVSQAQALRIKRGERWRHI